MTRRWKDFVPIAKEKSFSIWRFEQALFVLCHELGPEYRLQIAESMPDVDPVYAIHRKLPDGYDVEIMIQGNYRHRHYMVSLWARDGTECIVTTGDLFFGQIAECVAGLIQAYVPNDIQRHIAEKTNDYK